MTNAYLLIFFFIIFVPTEDSTRYNCIAKVHDAEPKVLFCRVQNWNSYCFAQFLEKFN